LFDPDGDADLDLLVTVRGGGKNLFYQNDGRGVFKEVARETGLDFSGSCFSATSADVDSDGDLDLYVCRYGDTDHTRPTSFIRAENGEPNLLYLNLGDGTFELAGEEAGVANKGWSYAASFCDYDADGHVDLYVANDFGTNQLYHNRGDGTFETVAGLEDPGNGMSVVWADIDEDGDPDLLVSNMYSSAGRRQVEEESYARSGEDRKLYRKFARGNTVLINEAGGKSFVDRSEELGLSRAGWAWGAAASDFDRDGQLDVYVANGYVTGEWEEDL
jgi:hypothetical protein